MEAGSLSVPCLDHGQRGDKDGYGTLSNHGRAVRAHRLAYAKAAACEVAAIRGLVVRHTCDNPRCVEPAHLVLGTHADNMRDKSERGRHTQAVLTADQIADIRTSGDTNAACAARYGVARPTISRIRSHQRWTHLP